MKARPWTQTLTATANAAGTCSVTFSTPQTVIGFRIDTIDFRVTGSVAIPVATATVNGQVLAVKRAGDRGQMIGEGDALHMSQQLTLTWTAADPGASCEATLSGLAQ